MPLRENARTLEIKEQVIQVGPLTLLFRVDPESTACYRLKLEGDFLPFGNYELLFDIEGKEAGGGTAIPSLQDADQD